ncbi:hypothetical protein BDR05DRAFT_451177 [Suillus weaverae]|nr:hypothetical protein BDR05DRAFT_451177 [Suillus weaverae]
MIVPEKRISTEVKSIRLSALAATRIPLHFPHVWNFFRLTKGMVKTLSHDGAFLASHCRWAIIRACGELDQFRLENIELVDVENRQELKLRAIPADGQSVRRSSLDSPIDDAGSHLLIGQHSLAGALVKGTNNLILDEAAGNYDIHFGRACISM